MNKTEEKENIELRLTFKPEDELYTLFRDIKRATGIKNNSEVVRFIIKQVSRISFSELVSNLQTD